MLSVGSISSSMPRTTTSRTTPLAGPPVICTWAVLFASVPVPPLAPTTVTVGAASRSSSSRISAPPTEPSVNTSPTLVVPSEKATVTVEPISSRPIILPCGPAAGSLVVTRPGSMSMEKASLSLGSKLPVVTVSSWPISPW